jgi:hypothetical protein
MTITKHDVEECIRHLEHEREQFEIRQHNRRGAEDYYEGRKEATAEAINYLKEKLLNKEKERKKVYA